MVKIELKLTRRHLYALVALLAAFALVIPTAGWAADKFKDVPDTNVFHDDIAWLADAGVTKGCNPPANDEFCPGDNVRRETMAAFMHRLAVSQVVDAKTAITAETADYATTAGDADLLEGFTAAQLQGNAPIAAATSGVGVGSPDWDWEPSKGEGGKTDVLSVTLDVPGDGVVIATGFAQVQHEHVEGTSDNIVVDITDDFANFDTYQGALLRDNWKLPSGYFIATTTPHRAFEVSQGTHTFTLVAARPQYEVNAQITHVTLAAVFYPTADG